MPRHPVSDLLLHNFPENGVKFLLHNPGNLRDVMAYLDSAAGLRLKNRGQTCELETMGGGCALVKRDVLQKLGLFPTRTPLGAFDLESLGHRVRHAGYRLAGGREAFIHHFGSRGAAVR